MRQRREHTFRAGTGTVARQVRRIRRVLLLAAATLSWTTTMTTATVRSAGAATGTIDTIVGGLGEAPAREVGLYPFGLASDGDAVFVVDEASNVVRRVALASGNATVVAGSGSLGFSGDGGSATAAELYTPRAVAISSGGDLFIADSGNNRIRRVDAMTGLIATVAGTGEEGFSGDGGPATAARLRLPQGLAIDAAGNVFIADSFNRRIRRVDAATGTISTIAGTGSSGPLGDGGPATAASLGFIHGLTLDGAGNLYASDFTANRVRRIDGTTGIITTVAGTGAAGFDGDGGPATAAKLYSPSGVAIDCTGALLIADSASSRVRRVDPASGAIATIAGGAPYPGSADGSAATAAFLPYPSGLTVDGSCGVLIGDRGSNLVRRVATTGIIATVAGNGSRQFSGDGGSATAAQITRSLGVASDLAGNLYLPDAENQRIRVVDATTGIIRTIAGNGEWGSGGDGGPATSAQFKRPAGVAVDAAGDVFVADEEDNRIRRIDGVSGLISTVAGYGDPVYFGDGGPAELAAVSRPSGVAFDASGNLLVVDTGNHRVRRIDALTGWIDTIAGGGASGDGGDGGPAAAAGLREPIGVAVDGRGHLYISDSGSHRVRRVDAATGVITTIAGTGVAGSSGDGGPATEALLGSLYGIACDDAGNVFVADAASQRVRRIDAATGVITTVAGTGIAGFAGDGGPATAARLNVPAGLAINPLGDLWIVEHESRRVRRISGPCSDGVVDGGEQCDDGNRASGDCCSPACSLESSATVCRVARGECDVAETCTGSSGACPTDAFVASLASCGDDGNPCTSDRCDGAGSCSHPANDAPCDDGLFCNGADSCGAGTCSVHAGDPCSAGSECADACGEVTRSCADPSGTPCSDDGSVCSLDVCDGSGSCVHPAGRAGATCRASSGDCDLAESCDGTSPICPSDRFRPSSHECRPADGACDVAERCGGAGPDCPADGFLVAGLACSDDGQPCTHDACDGAGACAHTALPDSDGDAVCDAQDPCTNVAGGRSFVTRPRSLLVLSRIEADPRPGNDRLTLRGSFRLPAGASFRDLDPRVHGARVMIRSALGTGVVDAALPAGAYTAGTRRGWQTNASGAVWRYLDRTATPIGSLSTLKITDRGHGAPGGLVAVTVDGKNGNYPATSADAPLEAILVLGDQSSAIAGQCGESDFGPADCAFNGARTTLACKR